MAQSCSKPVVVICHGDARDDDLFSVDDVREMISAALLAENIVDAMIVDVPDCESDDEWADRVLEAAGNPESPKVWSGDDDMKAIFEKREIEIQNISPVPGFNGTEIRTLIESGDTAGWREKVPGGSMEVIDNKFSKQ